MKSTFKAAVCALVLLAGLAACVKEDETDTRKSFSGSMNIPLEEYLEAGTSKDFCMDTLTTCRRDDGGGIGYYLKLPGADGVDTLKTENGDWIKKVFTVEVPDSLAIFEVELYAFAEGYYTTTSASSFTVVRKGLNGNSSLTNFNISEKDSVLTDERDGKRYYTTKIGDTRWMRQNLAWDGAGIPGMHSRALGDILGRFYTWDEAKTACPDGWRLPSDGDWLDLASRYGGRGETGKDIAGLAGHLMETVYFNRERMWEYWRDVNIDNASRLSIIPAGYATDTGNGFNFSGFKSYALFWTSDVKDGGAAFRYIYEDKDIVFYGLGDKKGTAATVRCIK